MAKGQRGFFRERIWFKSLIVKLALWVGFTAIFVISVFTNINTNTQRKHLLDEVILGTKQLSGTLTRSLRFNMLHNNREAIYNSIETIGAHEGIEKARIFNKEGKIMFSSDKEEMGRMVGKEAEACYACHAVGMPLEKLDTVKRARIFKIDNHRVLGMINPIYNEPDCYNAQCHAHPSEQKVLGVLDVAISLANTDQRLKETMNKTLIFSLITILAITIIIIIILYKSVNKPVKELVRATNMISAGEFEYPVSINSDDEIGQLAHSFRDMAERLRKADNEIKELVRTLEKRVEERTSALKAAQFQLLQSEKLASIGKLSATIAHEINNPLSGILTYTKLIEKRISRDNLPPQEIQKIKKWLLTMIKETERCSSIVKNLLDFARQREPALKSNVDINALIDDAISLLTNQISLQNIELKKILGDLPQIVADPMQLRQAFLNIIMNSCEAMPDGGSITIKTYLIKDSGMVMVEVADTGTGIDKEHLDKIFDPFFTTKEKGTGLGLSVVYGVINSHNGTLNVESKNGEGTRVSIKLPLNLEHDEKRNEG